MRTLFAGGHASSAPQILNHPFVDGELLVRVYDHVLPAEVADIAETLAATEMQRRLTRGLFLLRFDPSVDLADVMRDLMLDPRIIDVTPNYLGFGGFIPNDTIFGSQWQWESPFGGKDIDASSAWDITRGSASTLIAFLDSGIGFDHPEFTGRTYFNALEFPPDGFDDDGNGLVDDYRGWDFFNGDNNPSDDNGHGNWVTSMAAANTDNAFSGSGVDHFARILPLKVLDFDNSGTTASLVDALNHIAQRSDVQIVNLSLQGYPIVNLLGDALSAASDGRLVIGCAGNFGPDTADLFYPSAHPATTTVGATNSSDVIAPFSSTGTSVEVVAPGDNVGVGDNLFPYDDAALFFVDGCSFATPMVAGTASLLQTFAPGLSQWELHRVLEGSSEDLGPAGWDPVYGWGRLNAADALSYYLATWIFRDSFEIGDTSQWTSTVP